MSSLIRLRLCGWASLVLLLSVIPQVQARTERILIVNSYQAGSQWDARFEQGLHEGLAERSIWFFNQQIAVDSHNQQPLYRLAQQHLLTQVILHHRFDLVITIGEQALNMALDLQAEDSLQTPVVAAGANLVPYVGARERLVTGIHEQPAIRENILLIRQLIPDLEALYLLTDDAEHNQQTLERFVLFAKKFSIPYTIWQDVDYEELKAKSSLLTPNHAILLGMLPSSVVGNHQLSQQNLEALSLASRAPIFSLWDDAIGKGAVGGMVTPPERLGKSVAAIVLRALQGTNVKDIAIQQSSPRNYLLDYQQLTRWQMPTSNLTSNSIFMNRPAYQSWLPIYQGSLLFSGILLLSLCGLVWVMRRRYFAKQLQQAKQQQLTAVFTNTEQASVLLDEEGCVLKMNKAFEQLLGDRAHYLMGNPLLSSHVWQHQRALAQALSEAFARGLDGEVVRFNARFEAGEESCLYDFVISPQFHEPPTALLLLELRNLHLIESQYQQVTRDERHYRAMFEQAPAMLMVLNRLGVIVSCNQHIAQCLGFSPKQLELSQLRRLYVEEELQTSLLSYLEHIQDGVQTRQVVYQTRDKRHLWFRESILKFADEDSFMLCCEDVTTTHDLRQQLDFYANYDTLTGLYNRKFFEQRLSELLQQDSQQQHGLLLIDLTQFKVINDTFGHSSGDQALKQVAAALQQLLPDSALLARLGGNEFAILLEATQQQACLDFANVVIQRLKDTHYVCDERMFSFGCSVGMTLFGQYQASAQQILTQADKASFTAKSLGGNRAYLYQMDDQMLLERQGQMEWVTRIQKALREELFLLYAQPIVPVSADQDDYLHYEVLIRMIDEDGRVVPPGVFLPAAEKYNLAEQIDRMVIAKSLQWLTLNPGHLTRLTMCSMNLSGQSLGNSEFVDWLLKTLEESALPMNKLCFETTETVAIANFNVATEFFNQVRQLGCKIALDDFGSGLSSFGYLKNLPIDYLKIDGIFIRDLEHDSMDVAIVKSINQVAHVMGKQTIAEFVENEMINQILLDIGVDFAQGYHFGKPVPIEMLVLN